MAPQRLAGIRIADTISGQSEANLNSHVATSIYNPFAAVPSLHAGFAFAVGIAVAVALRRPWAKALALLWGPAVTLAVVAAGNHFLFDVAAGLLVTAAGFLAGRLAAGRLEQRPNRSRRLAEPATRTGQPAPNARRRLAMNALAPMAGPSQKSRSWTMHPPRSPGGARTRGCHITAPCLVTQLATQDGCAASM